VPKILRIIALGFDREESGRLGQSLGIGPLAQCQIGAFQVNKPPAQSEVQAGPPGAFKQGFDFEAAEILPRLCQIVCSGREFFQPDQQRTVMIEQFGKEREV
jgi:hypothetical protein